MLFAGKFPRIAVALAVLISFLMLLDLEFVPSVSASTLASNSLDLAMVILAAVCAFYASRRSSGFARQIWLLLAVALTLESLGQAIGTYYQSFVPNSALSPWPSDILFFVWAAPVFMIFLPRSEGELPGLDSLRILDFLQVAILAITLYLYFFYSPSRWHANQPALLRQILIVYIVRDFLLSSAFYYRSLSAFPPWLRKFCLVLATVFSVLVLVDIEYLYALVDSRVSAGWGDVIWLVPNLIVIVFALRWHSEEPSLVPSSPSPLGDILSSQILPIVIPLLVIFMGRAIAREQVVLGWLAVTSSVVCSSFRLILANRRQRYISDSLLSTERALRVSEQLLSTAFRFSPDAFSINPFPNGPYLELNEGFTRLTGYSREETLGKTPREMNLWIYPHEREKALLALTQTGHIRDLEFHFRVKSGETRVGQMNASVLELNGRRCSLVVVRDITERKEAEEILRSSEERFRSLVQNLHVGIVVYDPQVRILYTNQAVLDLFRTNPDYVIGKSLADFPLTAIREDGSIIPLNELPVPTVIATRKPVRNLVMGLQSPRLPQTVWTLLDAVPDYSSTGELLRVVVSLTDLTEQRRAAAALRESEERFRTLVSDLHVAVVLSQPDGRIEFANSAAYRMLGVPEGTAVGKFPTDLGVVPVSEDGKDIPPDDRPVPYVVRTRTPIENGIMGLRHSGAPGKIVWAFGNAVPQFDAQGNVIRVITAFSDITEMKNAERAIHLLSMQLLKLQDDERRRLGRELHDGLAQTVLAINLSLAQVRQSLSSSDSPAASSLEKARALTQQMSREIRTLSYLLHPPLLDDLGLVSALKEYTQGFSDRSGIATELLAPPDFSRLPQRLELALFRVVQESLSNIQRHSGSSSARISLHREDSQVTLEISDTGRGMIVPSNGDSHPHEPRLGVGIPGMRERIAQLGGQLDIDSGPTGTTVRATIVLGQVPSAEILDDSSSHPDRG